MFESHVGNLTGLEQAGTESQFYCKSAYYCPQAVYRGTYQKGRRVILHTLKIGHMIPACF